MSARFEHSSTGSPPERRGILCIGSIMVDVVCPIDSLPKSGEGVVSEGARMALGGCAFNSANAVRQSGGNVFLLAPVGKGLFASFVRGELERLGMDALEINGEAVVDSGAPYGGLACGDPASGRPANDRDPASGAPCGGLAYSGAASGRLAIDSGAAICLVEPDGERTMLTLPGIERRFELGWFKGFDLSPFGYAEVCGYEVDGIGGEAIVAFLEAHPELLLYFAPGPMIAKIDPERMRRLFALSPVLHVNALEARSFTGIDELDEAGFTLSELVGNAVVVTEGAKGAHVFIAEACEDGSESGQNRSALEGERNSEREREHEGGRLKISVPTDPVRPVDTIGAGDAHIGALMAKRASGASWRESLEYANRVSRAVCQVSGATLTDDEFARLVG